MRITLASTTLRWLTACLAIAAPLPCLAGAPQAPWVCPAGPFRHPIPDGAEVERVADALPSDAFNLFGTINANVEGPVWRNGALYISEFGLGPNPPPTRIIQVKSGLPGVVYLADAGTNGLAVDSEGVMYGASHQAGGIVRLGKAGAAPKVVIDRFKGARFNSPNDLAVRGDGTIYFTDPTWQAPVPPPQAKTRVYRVAPGATAATVVDNDRQQPNGVTLSPDEKTLYVSSQSGIHRYSVAADGSTGTPTRFAPQIASADGMVVDCAGNLYVTSGDVVVLDATGAELGRLPLPLAGAQVTNVAFGGKKHKTLFITAMGPGPVRGVYRVDLAVPGLPY